MRIAIIGAGPAGLMAADTLAPHAEVDLYEHGKHPGRKFLVAGQGGFNLTNAAEGKALLQHYTPAGFLDEALTAFGPMDLREWLALLGIDTFIGTSGRVFPVKGVKPIDVLERIRQRLLQHGVRLHTEHVFTGFDAQGGVCMENRNGPFTLEADHVLFALGGASWPVTGSTGIWPALFKPIGIEARPFQASNCGVEVPWPEAFIQAHEGKPLKNVRFAAGKQGAWGEATITKHGLEGNAIYPVVPALRDGETVLHADLKPDSSVDRLVERIGNKATRHFGEAVGMNRVQLALVKAFTPKEVVASPQRFAEAVKDLRIPVTGLRPLGEAISTVGGIPVGELNADFSLKRHPHLYAIGEMVDWDAPTGGFLLQGCFAMGRWAGRSILAQTS
ncbi:MAG TPA: TIGR03862 family flavoprotein [Flavobacteriales bacterium]|nr:TIGR03862 family flavoprotein [Flavobacteriales bacterium]